MVRYQSQRAPDTVLRGRLRDLANERRRFGYRRLFVLLRREGEPSGINRVRRLYREEGLTVRKRKARRKAIGTRAPILIEARANARWSLDFVHDQCACGRRFGVLNGVDDVTRECLAAIPDTSISGRRVARELTALIERRGRPRRWAALPWPGRRPPPPRRSRSWPGGSRTCPRPSLPRRWPALARPRFTPALALHLSMQPTRRRRPTTSPTFAKHGSAASILRARVLPRGDLSRGAAARSIRLCKKTMG